MNFQKYMHNGRTHSTMVYSLVGALAKSCQLSAIECSFVVNFVLVTMVMRDMTWRLRLERARRAAGSATRGALPVKRRDWTFTRAPPELI